MEEQGKQKPDTSKLGGCRGSQCKLESPDSKHNCFSFLTVPLSVWLFLLLLSHSNKDNTLLLVTYAKPCHQPSPADSSSLWCSFAASLGVSVNLVCVS